MDLLWNFITCLVLLNVLIIAHEFGHYISARYCGVKVERFSIGMGPELCGWTDKLGTRWMISWLPIGGYIAMLGEVEVFAEEGKVDLKDENNESRKQQSSRPAERGSYLLINNWKKMLISISGPLANYVYAFVVFVIVCVFFGKPTLPPVIGEVLESSAAQSAGLQSGDFINSINDKGVKKFEDVMKCLKESEGDSIKFLITRNEMQHDVVVHPKFVEKISLFGGKKHVKTIGIKSPKTKFIELSVFDSIKYAFCECVDFTIKFCNLFSELFSGKKSLDDFGSVVNIASTAGDIFKSDGLLMLLIFTAKLSLNLGFINLLPLPVVDGGRFTISLIEQICGRSLNPKIYEKIMVVCAIFLLLLMLLTVFNDILRLESVTKIVERILL